MVVHHLLVVLCSLVLAIAMMLPAMVLPIVRLVLRLAHARVLLRQ